MDFLFCLRFRHQGHEVSTFCRAQLLDILALSGDCFVHTFERLHDALVASPIDVDSSGTTSTVVVINNGTIEVNSKFIWLLFQNASVDLDRSLLLYDERKRYIMLETRVQ